MDGWRNEEVRRSVGVKEKTTDRVDQRVLKWFGNVDRKRGPNVD